MSHRYTSESSQKLHRAEEKIPLSYDQGSEIIDDLTYTVDELRFLAEPASTSRALGNISLIPDAESALPASYQQLELEQATFRNGLYKSRITLPGRTLRLEGTDGTRSRSWGVTSGDKKLPSLQHTDLVNYLRTAIPQNSMLDELADTAYIDDNTMNDSLWQALSPLTKTWHDKHTYNEDVYHFSLAPHESAKDFMSNIGAVVQHIETPESSIYSSAISNTKEIAASWSNLSNKSAEVREEYRFGVEFPKQHEKTRQVLAVLALESSDIADGRLARIANAGILRMDDPSAIYLNATKIVRDSNLKDFNF